MYEEKDVVDVTSNIIKQQLARFAKGMIECVNILSSCCSEKKTVKKSKLLFVYDSRNSADFDVKDHIPLQGVELLPLMDISKSKKVPAHDLGLHWTAGSNSDTPPLFCDGKFVSVANYMQIMPKPCPAGKLAIIACSTSWYRPSKREWQKMADKYAISIYYSDGTAVKFPHQTVLDEALPEAMRILTANSPTLDLGYKCNWIEVKPRNMSEDRLQSEYFIA